MKFFTANWHSGRLSEKAYAAALANYSRYLRAIQPTLPPSLRRLAAGLSLHDGLVEKARIGSHTLALSLRVGDLQRGYSSVTLRYSGVRSPGSHASKLKRAALSGAELLSDEIGVASSGFTHSLYFSEGTELEIAFTALALSQSPRRSRRLSLPPSLRVRTAAVGAA